MYDGVPFEVASYKACQKCVIAAKAQLVDAQLGEDDALLKELEENIAGIKTGFAAFSES